MQNLAKGNLRRGDLCYNKQTWLLLCSCPASVGLGATQWYSLLVYPADMLSYGLEGKLIGAPHVQRDQSPHVKWLANRLRRLFYVVSSILSFLLCLVYFICSTSSLVSTKPEPQWLRFLVSCVNRQFLRAIVELHHPLLGNGEISLACLNSVLSEPVAN